MRVLLLERIGARLHLLLFLFKSPAQFFHLRLCLSARLLSRFEAPVQLIRLCLNFLCGGRLLTAGLILLRQRGNLLGLQGIEALLVPWLRGGHPPWHD